VWATCCSSEGSQKYASPGLVVETMMSELKKAQGNFDFEEFVDIIVGLVMCKNGLGAFGVDVDGREVRIDMADVVRELLRK
jgi:hypothetical protein